MDPCALRATLGRVEDLGQIAAVVVACGTALVFALMAWAGQHQS
jgi:pantothenate kinase type III